jgi:hypothetical protein
LITFCRAPQIIVTCFLTDGYTDNLDCSKLKGKLLIISVGVGVQSNAQTEKVKQIVLESNE